MFCFVVVVLLGVDHEAVADGFYELADVSSGKCSKFSLGVEYVAEGCYDSLLTDNCCFLSVC